MDKAYILQEIVRTAKENNGIPLGRVKFEKEAGIRYHDWYGKFWSRWNDALAEAGYPPNKMQPAYDETFLIEKVISLVREIHKFPTDGELRLKACKNSDFPNSKTIQNRFGGMSGLTTRILSYCQNKPGYSDIIVFCKTKTPTLKVNKNVSSKQNEPEFGFVYIMKHGKKYKIGHSYNVERRNYELGIKLPEELNIIHKITTDDPVGIENYWHERFKTKRTHGEWFDLSSEDISTFKRRKFM